MKNNKKPYKKIIITFSVLFYLYIYLVFSTSEFISDCGDYVNTLITPEEPKIEQKYNTLVDGGNKRLWLLRKIGCN